jgi:hypothetical protein
MQIRQNGFGIVPVIAVIAVVAVVGLLAWRLWPQPEQKQTDAQHAKDIPAADEPIKTEQPPADKNKGYVVLKDWGVRFKPTAALGTVEFEKLSERTYTFSTVELAAREPSCRVGQNDIQLGTLHRVKEGEEVNLIMGGVFTTINGYQYQHRSTDAACSENPANYEFESGFLFELSKSLDSLEAAQ